MVKRGRQASADRQRAREKSRSQTFDITNGNGRNALVFFWNICTAHMSVRCNERRKSSKYDSMIVATTVAPIRQTPAPFQKVSIAIVHCHYS